MDTQNKYLLLARRAREEDNTEDAKKYYDMVRTEDPENAEAKFYYSYYRMMDGTKGESYGNFIAFCNGIDSTVSMIIASDESIAEKMSFFEEIFDCIEIANRIVVSADTDIQGGHRSDIGRTYGNTMDSFVDKIKSSYKDNVEMLALAYSKQVELALSRKTSIPGFYDLGDEIAQKSNSNQKMIELAVTAWKAGIKKQQQDYNTSDAKRCAGFAEKYAEKIKKYEPSYTIPKKAGCISFG